LAEKVFINISVAAQTESPKVYLIASDRVKATNRQVDIPERLAGRPAASALQN
jgi:hypothetical protein